MAKLDTERIRSLIEKKPMQFVEFAREIGVQKQALYRIFDTRSTKRSTVEKMAKALEVPVESLYEGGPPPVSLPENKKSNILFVPMQAQAGFFSGYDGNIEALLFKFSLPEMTDGTYYAFTVTGDSMYPTIKSGDVVVCSKLESKEEIKPKTVHVIFDKTDGVIVKRLILHGEELRCISDNKQYQEYSIKSKTVKDIYRVRRVITSSI